MNNPIDDKILEINEKDPIKRAELILNVLYPYAKGFLDLWLEFMKMKNVYNLDAEKFIKAIYFHEFAVWLSTQGTFNDAKDKMAAQKLIYFGEEAKKTFNLDSAIENCQDLKISLLTSQILHKFNQLTWCK